MTKYKTIALITTGALLLAAVFGVIGYRSVSAQTPTPAAPADGAAPTLPDGGKPDGGLRGGFTDADLASALGITTDQLTTARQSAAADALKQAVAQGLITQEQADQITADGRGFGGRFFKDAGSIDYDALLAQALNITTDQLKAAQVKAVTAATDRAVAGGTMTQAQADLVKARAALSADSAFQSSLQSAYESALQQAVTDGVITQAQADALLQQSPRWGGLGGPGGFDDGFGGRGGRGHGGPRPGDSTAPSAPTAPTDTAPAS